MSMAAATGRAPEDVVVAADSLTDVARAGLSWPEVYRLLRHAATACSVLASNA
jgi:hypothetical protein